MNQLSWIGIVIFAVLLITTIISCIYHRPTTLEILESYLNEIRYNPKARDALGISDKEYEEVWAC